MSMKKNLEALERDMERWQSLETAGVAQTSRIMEQTENPLVSLVLEIIQRDSHVHRRVQQVVRDSLANDTVTLTPDDLGTIWDGIKTHIAMERESIEIATRSLEKLREGQARGYLVQQYLIAYMLEDEKKHDKMLSDLELLKRNMYPYG